MTQGQNFMFGIDNIAFIDDEYNVYAVDDPQSASLNLTFEKTEHRGGTNNDIRAVAVHTRSGELSLGSGYVDAKFAQLLTGGTITSLGTSAASVTTGSVTGVNTLYGTTATIPTGIQSVILNSPTLVKTTDYYLTATSETGIDAVRVSDGKAFAGLTMADSVAVTIDTDRGVAIFTQDAAGGFGSLTVGEKAYISVRTQIKTLNQKIKFDTNKPTKLSVLATVNYNGYQRQMNIPVAQPMGSIQGNSATEFQVQEITMGIENSSALDELADVVIQG